MEYDIIYKRSARAKNSRITIKSSSEVVVTIPIYGSLRAAKKFVLTNKVWIDKKVSTFQKTRPKKTLLLPNSSLQSGVILITTVPSTSSKFSFSYSENSITIKYPSDNSLTKDEFDLNARKGVIEALRAMAKEQIPAEVEVIAKKLGLTYNNLYIKNQKTRWGSCSSVNNINLNLHLMRLPDYIRKYIIVHELIHIIEKNHGKNFHSKVKQVIPEYKLINKELKRYNPNVL